MGRLRRCLCVCLCSVFLIGVAVPKAQAGPAREILMTSTYGLLAGSLVGLASLAFYSSPGSHLKNIAMGGSMGLYVGIILGVYIAYGVSLDGDKPPEEGNGPLEETPKEEQKKDENGLPLEPPKDAPNPQGLQEPPSESGVQLVGSLMIHAPLISIAPIKNEITGKLGWMAHSDLVRMSF